MGREDARLSIRANSFVHAKLVAAVSGYRGWVLSGSANISKAGLTRSVRQGGNVELCVLTEALAESVQAAFIPPETLAIDADLSDLFVCRFEHEEAASAHQVALLSASAREDGRVEIVSQPESESTWRLSDLTNSYLLSTDGGSPVTAEAVTGRLVELLSGSGPLSRIGSW